MTSSNNPPLADGIAVIGLAGRFPGAATVDEFWQNLCAGVEAVTFFSEEQLLAAGENRQAISAPGYVRAAAICADSDMFDAGLFGISAREAELTNPQHRMLLECAWEALERGGYDPKNAPGRVGLFAGAGMNGYLWQNVYENQELMSLPVSYQAIMRNGNDFLTTYVSYLLGLRGPSVNLQTACSTSLVAIHMACMSLLNGECEMALAGGVRLNTPQTLGYAYQEGGIHSSDGHCRPFAADSQGIVSGNGAGVVLLKPLDQALADGNPIYAVIRGSAINNDGTLKAGYTAPSVSGQVEVIRAAQAMAEVEPETIGYIEAHGTGTPIGDPIEVAALTQAFRSERRQFCGLGSLKSNMGHLDAAAGVAGLIKAVLALHHASIPPSLHAERTNPTIDFAASPFYVNTTLKPWERGDQPRRAGVSSFGIGGTNAHIVLEEAPPSEPSPPAAEWQVLLLAAKTTTALDTATANLADYLEREPAANLADIAHTLHVGRHAFAQRRMVVARDAADARKLLTAQPADRVLSGQASPQARPIAYLFSGQGAQYPDMGRGLYERERVFRQQVDRCAGLLQPHLGRDIRELIYPAAGADTAAELSQTALTQPALFVIEYALAKLLGSWGFRPQALAGHSVGQYAAACVAGVIGLEDALALVAARGALIQRLPGGVMLAVPLAEAELAPLLGRELSLAAINGPARCVASGPAAAIAELEALLSERGVASQRLHTSHAFHSPMMEPILEPFLELVRTMTLKPPRIPLLSNATGTWMTAEEAQDPAAWVRHLREPVRWSANLEALFQTPELLLLELGPGRTLRTFAQQHPARPTAQAALAILRHPAEQADDRQTLLSALGQLWLAGASIDWAKLAPAAARRVPLPTYPFERQRYWSTPTPASVAEPSPRAAAAPEVASPPAATQALPAPELAPADGIEALIARQMALLSQGADLMAQQLEALAHE